MPLATAAVLGVTRRCRLGTWTGNTQVLLIQVVIMMRLLSIATLNRITFTLRGYHFFYHTAVFTCAFTLHQDRVSVTVRSYICADTAPCPKKASPTFSTV